MKIGTVIIPIADSKTGAAHSYTKLRQLAQTADSSGLDSIWLFDHLLYRFDRDDPNKTTGIWECWTLLCALAEATTRVELGTVVLCSPFRNPALLAKMAHTLDEVSAGRLILGIGAGWHKPEFDAFGYPFDRRVDRFAEAVQIIKPLLQGKRIDFSGSHYQVQDCLITPLGPRPAGIPLLIGAGRPRMLGLVAQYADQWNTAWLGSAQELPERLERIHTACSAVGRDPASLRITVGVQASFPDLGEAEPFLEKPLSGTAADLARAFQEFEAAGADHLIIMHTPSTLPALERVVEGVRLYKSAA